MPLPSSPPWLWLGPTCWFCWTHKASTSQQLMWLTRHSGTERKRVRDFLGGLRGGESAETLSHYYCNCFIDWLLEHVTIWWVHTPCPSRHLPSEPALHFNLANTLGKLSRYEESESHFLLATNLDPGNANYWANLGVLYHRWRKYEQAEKSYLHALKLNPTLKSAQDNLNMLLKATGKIYR